MKPDTERKKHYKAKLHKKRNDLHVHLSKDLRTKLKKKKRSILVRSGDSVRVMRGPGKGKDGKVSRVDTVDRKVFVDGVTARNAKAKEILLPLQPSNLMLTGLESTKERKKLFSEDAFKAPKKKEEPKKEEKKPEPKKEKPEPKKEEPKKEAEAKKPEKPAEAKAPEAPKKG